MIKRKEQKMPGSKLPPGLKALKKENAGVVAKMLGKSVDEVKKMKKGGKVGYKKGGSVKCKRDGICVRGKTKGRMV